MDTVAQCTSLAPQILGFIFFELFSNLGRTGCRRGRTPERPLRQPSKVWLISQTVFRFRPCRRKQRFDSPLSESWVNPPSLRSAQVATCAERMEPTCT